MSGIIGAAIFLIIAFIILYYVILDLVMKKWSGEAIQENGRQIILVIALFVLATVLYMGRHPTAHGFGE